MRYGPSAASRAIGAAALCIAAAGCAAAPERLPLKALVEEARLASQAVPEAGSVQAQAPRERAGAKFAEHPPVSAAAAVEAADSRIDQTAARAPYAPSPDTAPVPIYVDGTPFLPPEPLPPLAPLVSEIFVETDVREALQILAGQASVSVIVDEQARGVTSATIENEPFEAALEKILLPLGYVYRREGEQYLVGVPDPSSALFSRIAERHDYHARHLPPGELLELLPAHLKPFVRISEKRNLIIVEAPARIVGEILEDLSRSDQPVGQVVLEAFVCVISPESGLEFGVDVQQGIPFGGPAAVDLALAGMKLVSDHHTPGLSGVAFTSALIRALAREGYVSIRAAPRVMAKDGETARISIAKETFFSIQPPNAQFLFRQDIQRIEAGIGLDITPVIRGDQITMNIERAEVSEGLDNAAILQQQANTFPIINRRRVATTVHVSDGETITIGGLVHRQQVERLNKIPLLGDIPFVGQIFHRIDRREEDAEVIIFISPRIVREETPWIEQ